VEWFVAVVIVAALGVAAVAAAGGLGGMAKEPVRDIYRQDLPADRPLAAPDVQALRFGTALRGYAMGQVDDVLDRLAREISDRDALIAELRTMVGLHADPGVADPTVANRGVADPTAEGPAAEGPAEGAPTRPQILAQGSATAESTTGEVTSDLR
jgi:DivIVA domain-containing protein